MYNKDGHLSFDNDNNGTNGKLVELQTRSPVIIKRFFIFLFQNFFYEASPSLNVCTNGIHYKSFVSDSTKYKYELLIQMTLTASSDFGLYHNM